MVDHGPSSSTCVPVTRVYAERQETISSKLKASVRVLAWPPTAGSDDGCLGRNVFLERFFDEPAKRARICMEVKGFFGIRTHRAPRYAEILIVGV